MISRDIVNGRDVSGTADKVQRDGEVGIPGIHQISGDENAIRFCTTESLQKSDIMFAVNTVVQVCYMGNAKTGKWFRNLAVVVDILGNFQGSVFPCRPGDQAKGKQHTQCGLAACSLDSPFGITVAKS